MGKPSSGGWRGASWPNTTRRRSCRLGPPLLGVAAGIEAVLMGRADDAVVAIPPAQIVGII